MQQLQMEAQHRWLRPAEICEILCNYQKFLIASEPPSRPPSMLFANYNKALDLFYINFAILRCIVKHELSHMS